MRNEKMVLQSAEPLERVSNGVLFYGVFTGVGAMVALFLLFALLIEAGIEAITPPALGLVVLIPVVCGLIGWGIRNKMMKYKSLGLRRQRFFANNKLSGGELYQRLFPVLQPTGMELAVTKDGTLRVTHMNLCYDVIFHEDDSFSILWSQSLGRALLGGNYYISIYKRAVVAMGIIGFHVQSACR